MKKREFLTNFSVINPLALLRRYLSGSARTVPLCNWPTWSTNKRRFKNCWKISKNVHFQTLKKILRLFRTLWEVPGNITSLHLSLQISRHPNYQTITTTLILLMPVCPSIPLLPDTRLKMLLQENWEFLKYQNLHYILLLFHYVCTKIFNWPRKLGSVRFFISAMEWPKEKFFRPKTK